MQSVRPPLSNSCTIGLYRDKRQDMIKSVPGGHYWCVRAALKIWAVLGIMGPFGYRSFYITFRGTKMEPFF